jgi:hypothetical protein
MGGDREREREGPVVVRCMHVCWSHRGGTATMYVVYSEAEQAAAGWVWEDGFFIFYIYFFLQIYKIIYPCQCFAKLYLYRYLKRW